MKRYVSCFLFVFSLVSFLVTGCALQWNKVYSPTQGAESKIAEILRYFHDKESLPQEELLYLYAQEEEQFLKKNNDQSALVLALLLTLPQTEFQDISRAMTLLNAYLSEDKHPKSLRNFASLLSYMVSKKKNQEALYEIARKKLHDTHKERNEKEIMYKKAKQELKDQESLYKKLYKELDEEKKTVEDLRQQIEQIKTIEKNINERKQDKSPET